MQEMILLIFLKKKLFRIKKMYLKQKEKNQKRKEAKNFLNILSMNQRILTKICLNNILILKYLLF